jgi:hypothetical protein
MRTAVCGSFLQNKNIRSYRPLEPGEYDFNTRHVRLNTINNRFKSSTPIRGQNQIKLASRTKGGVYKRQEIVQFPAIALEVESFKLAALI